MQGFTIQALLHCREKRLLRLSCPTASISAVLDFGYFIKICRETSSWVKIEQKSGALHEDLSTFYCCRRHKFANKKTIVV